MNLLSAIKTRPADNIALQDDRRTLSYGATLAEIATRAAQLKNISCAALAMDNGVEWILWDMAALESGTVLVPLPPFFTPAQVTHALSSSGCQAIIEPQGIRPLPYPPAALPHGTAKITYTSGTTGTPKGVCLSRAHMETVARSIVEMLGPEYAGIHLSVLPLGVLLENVAGVYAALMAGARVVVPPLEVYGPHYAGLRQALATTRATSAIIVPEILRSLMLQVARNGPLPDLRFIAVGGSKISSTLIEQAQARGLPAYEGYGLSECGSVVTLNVPGHTQPGTAGRLLPHVDAVIENGELVIRNPAFLGYVGQPQSGPYATGDLGDLDAGGYFTISGRKRNVLITSYGRNISPEWVEAALLSQPEIAQAFVYGDAQPALSALIVPGGDPLSIPAAIARANLSLPDYAHIGAFHLTPAFTRQDGTLTGNGRLCRDAILKTRLTKETAMTFYERLRQETETARQELYSVPQLIDGLRGDISRETYIAYLTEAYHHVRHTVRFLMAMGAHLPESKKWLHEAISEYIEEEKGHEEWILNDIAAAGGDKEAARAAIPNLETQVLVSYNYDYIARKNPIGFLGMVFMLESTSVQAASNGADAVKSKLGLPQAAFTYLYSHGALDIEHMKFFEQLVNQIDDPGDRAAIIEVAQNTFRLFANVMRAIPHERSLKSAA
ncbi:MAG: AMP-binding protein [Micavibrio aeruginosavorus]|uniref:AMP-binding protein n=1 Tax=Micavibrio aeruginosavorus TaxID=349221 RepID=A0A7T5R3N1_9BACT|nr:MAG: AMP-binding protein [Micavibrio aeruginosavorus]